MYFGTLSVRDFLGRNSGSIAYLEVVMHDKLEPCVKDIISGAKNIPTIFHISPQELKGQKKRKIREGENAALIWVA